MNNQPYTTKFVEMINEILFLKFLSNNCNLKSYEKCIYINYHVIACIIQKYDY